MNTFGELFRLTTFGESHGPAMGSVIDGCPAGIPLLAEQIQIALNRRRPGQSALVTPRAESDLVEILSGVYEGKTLGTPIAAVVRNHDARSADYDQLKPEDRPGHADATWRERFKHRDPRGGGRTSGRETLCRVIGGSIAEALLATHAPSVKTVAWVSQVATVECPEPDENLSRDLVDSHPTRMPDAEAATRAEALILHARNHFDSLGGSITVRTTGLPIGLGEPVFGKLKSTLASALSGIGAVTGVVWGPADLESQLRRPGTEFHQHDAARPDAYGGIQGGLTNGEPLQLRILFKPPATLGSHAKGGRHDPCILPRAVPVVEAMVSLVLADAYLLYWARPHRA